MTNKIAYIFNVKHNNDDIVELPIFAYSAGDVLHKEKDVVKITKKYNVFTPPSFNVGSTKMVNIWMSDSGVRYAISTSCPQELPDADSWEIVDYFVSVAPPREMYYNDVETGLDIYRR